MMPIDIGPDTTALFRGTDISVIAVGKLAHDGASIADILSQYPDLNEKDVRMARRYYEAMVLLLDCPPRGVK